METPDGQKKQQEIIAQMGQISEKLLNTIFAKVLQSDKTQVHQALNLVNQKGKINADVNVTYTGKQAPKLAEIASFTPNDWAQSGVTRSCNDVYRCANRTRFIKR